MSYVLWATEHDSVELSGSERAYARVLLTKQATAVLHGVDKAELFERLVNPDWLERPPLQAVGWWEAFETWFGSGDTNRGLVVGGTVIGTLEMTLNTAIAQGNDSIKLLAWMHGLCEDHGRIEPAQHAWLRRAIGQGRRDNILRGTEILGDRSWENVLAFVERHPRETIVWSYSVCNQFPHAGGEREEDERSWRAALGDLRHAWWPPAVGANLDQGFASGSSAYDLVAEIEAASKHR